MELFSSQPYDYSQSQKDRFFLNEMHKSYQFHFSECEAYRKYCEKRGFTLDSTFNHLYEIPYLPAQAFKMYGNFLNSVSKNDIKTTLNSSATGGVPSTVLIDGITAKRQVKALMSVMASVIGNQRLPFMIMDLNPLGKKKADLGARTAAVYGFLNSAKKANYFMIEDENGLLELDYQLLIDELRQQIENNEPIVVMGFTYVLYQHVILPLIEKNQFAQLPKGSFVLHIGGWKKLEDKKVKKEIFNHNVSRIFGVETNAIIDIYGFTEQMGVVYPDMSDGFKYLPLFSDVVVRDPVTHVVLPDGETGLLQFITPLPNSYPGISVLTDDIGYVEYRNHPVTRQNIKAFKVIGRAKKAEIRGCGDIMGDKMIIAKKETTEKSSDQSSSAYLLFDHVAMYTSPTLDHQLDLEKLPKIVNLKSKMQELRDRKSFMEKYSVDEIILLISEASKLWRSENSVLKNLDQQGLSFLSEWCKPERLKYLLDTALRERGYLDGFKPFQSNRKNLMAVSKGLVGHWLSGNVPLLGMLALVQSILARNANILRVSSSFSTALPIILNSFRELEVTTVYGKKLFGRDIIASIAVIYYPHDNYHIAETLSAGVDVRLVWGGKEAVEAISQLPKRFDADDIIFGPKLSFMVIGKEYLSDERQFKKIVKKAAIDSVVFDQYACASPHTIFVERGGDFASPQGFAEYLATEMKKAGVRIPKNSVDAGTVSNINGIRLKYEFIGHVWSSEDHEWTVLYDEKGSDGPVSPTYSRVITVRAIESVFDIAEFIKPGIQTIGLALDGKKKIQFAEMAAKKGADRLPDIGRMTHFDSPWDGLFLMQRLVKWVSLGGPL